VCRLCDDLEVRFYIPFASQAVFHRCDSHWANDFRTTYENLRQCWHSPARLLPPYTTLDLTEFSHRSTPPEQYRPMEPSRVARLTAQRSAEEETAAILSEDVAGLERKLNVFRWLLGLLFPHGFAFQLGERRLRYQPWRGRLDDRDGPSGRDGEFVIEIPKLTLKEALRNNHLTDLGITMFVRIRLLQRLDPRKVYALFVLFQFDDYGHLRSIGALLRWVGLAVRYTLLLRLPVPQPEKRHP
jgi:hypothetical protein